MTLWLDASALMSLIAREPTSDDVDCALQNATGALIVSDLGIAEVSSAISRLVRTGDKTADESHLLFNRLDGWTAALAERIEVTSDDIAFATDLVRRQSLALRAPDAIHIAGALHVGATLITLDKAMARAARTLGLLCINPADA